MSACEGGYFEFVFSYILFSSPTRESRGVLQHFNQSVMKVETKYNIGDTLWTIDENSIKQFVVSGISIFVNKGQTSRRPVETLYVGKDLEFQRYEERCFPTKEELIKSL